MLDAKTKKLIADLLDATKPEKDDERYRPPYWCDRIYWIFESVLPLELMGRKKWDGTANGVADDAVRFVTDSYPQYLPAVERAIAQALAERYGIASN